MISEQVLREYYDRYTEAFRRFDRALVAVKRGDGSNVFITTEPAQIGLALTYEEYYTAARQLHVALDPGHGAFALATFETAVNLMNEVVTMQDRYRDALFFLNDQKFDAQLHWN